MIKWCKPYNHNYLIINCGLKIDVNYANYFHNFQKIICKELSDQLSTHTTTLDDDKVLMTLAYKLYMFDSFSDIIDCNIVFLL